MNPLKSSSSQQYNRIDNSHSNVMLPCKRLPTTGDGNCLIHALFGEFSYVRHFLLDEVQQEFFHKNAPAVRFEIANRLFNQGEGNHAIYEELCSIDELGSVTSSPININNLALSLQENGEYLGLEHAHLVAKLFRINVRVYYPKSHAYERIDFLHRDSNTQEVDRIVYFNGINHWEKCELINEPGLPSSLDFVSQYSFDESTTASRRSSFDLRPKPKPNPKYKQIFSYQESLGLRGYNPVQRIETNNQFIQSLQVQINKKINGSYLFTIGKQEKNERFDEVFVDFFREIRGTNPLVNSSGEYLANKFVTSPDMCKIYETSTFDEYGIDTSTEISPTIQLINELKQILEDEYGLQNQFLGALDKNGKRITDFAKLGDRDIFLATLPKDHPYRQKWGLQTAPVYIPLSMIAKLFPKCVEALKEVFNSLLITQWLKNDIDGVKLYLNENDYVDRPIPSLEDIELAVRLWETAKDYGEKQRKYDTEIEAKHWNEFQNDLWGTMVSGGLSICTVNPSFVIGKAAHTMMNVLSNQVDPEGSDKRVQVLKMFGGVGLGGVMGGNPWDLGTSLGIDLVELAVRDKKTTKGESAALTLWGSVLKGALTGDQKKLVCQILGGCVAEAVNQLPETDENTSLERRIARALLTNSDVQAHFIKGFVDKRFKDDPKPKTGGVLTPEEQEKYPKQVITETEPEQIIKEPEIHDPEGYKNLLLEEKGLQASLEKAKSDLVTPQSILEQEQQALAEKQAKVDKYAKKGGNSAYERWLHYKEKRDDHTIKRNVAQGNVNNINGRIAELNGKITENHKSQAIASSPKHIPAPNSGVHIIGDQKTGENHHPYYFESGKKQGLGKYDNAEDARHISGLFTKIETNKLSLEMQCFDAQGQLVEAGFSIDDIPKRPNLGMPTILGNDVDANSKTLNTAGVNHKKEVQAYLKSVETLLGKPIVTQGLSKSEISDIRKQVTPKIKDPKEHGFFFNTYRSTGKGIRKGFQWLDDHGVSLNVNVNISTDLYKTNTKERTPSHVGNYGYDAPKQKPLSNLGQWENVQATQRDQLFNMNMEYKSLIDNSPQGKLDYQQFWGQGLANNVQMPPSDCSGLGRNPKEHVIPGMKHYPDGDRTQSNIPKWLRYFASGGESIDPQERIDRNTQSLVATAKVAGQAFGEIADELRSFGCVNAKFDQGRVTLRFDRTISSQIDGLMDQFLPNMDHVSNFRYVEFTARIANDIMLEAFMMPLFQLGKAKPLIDRVLVRPQGFGQQVRMIEAFQQPALRSGLGFPKMGLMPGQPKVLAERNISKIRTDWVLPKKGGATINGRWYTEHALERMAPRTPEVMAELEVRALARARKEGCLPQTKEFGKWMEKNAPNPRNIPPSVVEAEISKPGSTNIRVELNQKGDVITVIPGGKK